MKKRIRATRFQHVWKDDDGGFYGRVKVGGKVRETRVAATNLERARRLVAEWVAEVRGEAARAAARAEDGSWGSVVDGWVEAQMRRPDLSAHSRRYYAQVGRLLREVAEDARAAREVSAEEVGRWWERVGKERSANFANVALRAVQGIFKELVEKGELERSPAGKVRAMSVRAKELVLPSAEQLARIIAEVRAHGSRHRGESARMIEFLAFSGLRISEAQRVHWEDVVVDGEGRWVMRVEGSKGRAGALRVRRLPVSDDLRRVLLDTVPGAQGREDLPAAGRMWHILTPLVAMRNACARLGLRRWTVHDLRHYFATRCIECGVDVPTVSRWLGHSDGGVLAMRTYGHLRDAHSMEAVRRVVF